MVSKFILPVNLTAAVILNIIWVYLYWKYKFKSQEKNEYQILEVITLK